MAPGTGWTWVFATARLRDPSVDAHTLDRENLQSALEKVGASATVRDAFVLLTRDHEHSAGVDPGFDVVMAWRTIDPGIVTEELVRRGNEVWGPLAAAVTDPAVHSRAELCSFDASSLDGGWLVAVRVDFRATEQDAEAQERDFNEWYTYEHVGDICRGQGFHRGWRMQRDASGDHQTYWVFYESDAAEDLVRSRAGKAPWGGLWAGVIDQDTFCRSYHEIVARFHRP
ncbi:hypothetical protein WJ438_10670 [Streptomyces sp. GD-15H]|uniref:hypothetical protein n=1 Tax=Streptomyces sp. GD-15H TaxID=3129112 RepID=UPI0032472640